MCSTSLAELILYFEQKQITIFAKELICFVFMCRLRWLCGGILMLLTLTVSAQDLRTQVEQLRTDMYRLFGTDSLQ